MIFLLLIRVYNGKVPLCRNVGGFWCEQNNPESLVVSFHDGAAIECIRTTATECKRLYLRLCRANIFINQAILKRNINNEIFQLNIPGRENGIPTVYKSYIRCEYHLGI